MNIGIKTQDLMLKPSTCLVYNSQWTFARPNLDLPNIEARGCPKKNGDYVRV